MKELQRLQKENSRPARSDSIRCTPWLMSSALATAARATTRTATANLDMAV